MKTTKEKEPLSLPQKKRRSLLLNNKQKGIGQQLYLQAGGGEKCGLNTCLEPNPEAKPGLPLLGVGDGLGVLHQARIGGLGSRQGLYCVFFVLTCKHSHRPTQQTPISTAPEVSIPF
jgi:hypothetical protein